MNSIETYRDAMINAGITKQMAESKTAMIALSVLSNNPDLIKVYDIEQIIRDTERKAVQALRRYDCLTDMVERLESKYGSIKANIEASEIYQRTENMCDRMNEYLDRFFESINNCETKEGRDAIKAAQMFVNTVEVNSKYDNTAFIAGMAAILSRTPSMSLDRLEKVNHKIEAYKKIDDRI